MDITLEPIGKIIDIPIEKVIIDAYQPSVSQITMNTLLITSGGVHRVLAGINHIIIDVHEKVIIVLPEIITTTISSDGGEHIYQSILITITRLIGDHQIKTPNIDIKINKHMTSVYLDDQVPKYHFVAISGGWIAYQ